MYSLYEEIKEVFGKVDLIVMSEFNPDGLIVTYNTNIQTKSEFVIQNNDGMLGLSFGWINVNNIDYASMFKEWPSTHYDLFKEKPELIAIANNVMLPALWDILSNFLDKGYRFRSIVINTATNKGVSEFLEINENFLSKFYDIIISDITKEEFFNIDK